MEDRRYLRLLFIVDKLDQVARESPSRFCYARWVGPDWGGKQDLSCGTFACALGWGATIPELRKLGLCLERDNDAPALRLKSGATIYDPIEVICELFGITHDEARFLFYPVHPQLDYRASAKQVADHILRFAERKSCEIKTQEKTNARV